MIERPYDGEAPERSRPLRPAALLAVAGVVIGVAVLVAWLVVGPLAEWAAQVVWGWWGS